MFERLNRLLDKSSPVITGFAVAAIIIDKNGKEYEGFNIEYSTLSPSICAERTAIVNATLQGMKPGDLREVHILSKNNKVEVQNKEFFISPCGVCRQVIGEMSQGECDIHMYNLKGEVMKSNLKTLLPFAFLGDVFNV